MVKDADIRKDRLENADQQKQEEIRKKGEIEKKKLGLTILKRQQLEEKLERETEKKIESLEMK